jgi:rhodanese-related sulfurtransferase
MDPGDGSWFPLAAGSRSVAESALLFQLALDAMQARIHMDLQFLQDNWLLLVAMIGSGAMWLWLTVRDRWSPIREIGAMEATQLINRRDALMLDLREAKEYEGGRVPNAVHLPQSQLASRAHELEKLTARPVIAYCDRGQRSRSAAAALTRLGFTEVYTLRGGLRAWSEAGLPLEKGA